MAIDVETETTVPQTDSQHTGKYWNYLLYPLTSSTVFQPTETNTPRVLATEASIEQPGCSSDLNESAGISHNTTGSVSYDPM